MKRIASRDNPLFKTLRRLGQSAYARKQGMSLLEGVHLCEAYLQWAGSPRHAIFDAARAEVADGELRQLLDTLPGDCVVLLENRLIDDLETVEAGQGVVFLIDTPAPAMPERIDRNCMLLDRIQDPGNVGSILRTCAAAGIRQVFLSAETASAWSTKVLRAGQGAHFSLDIYEQVDLEALLARLDVPLLATTLDDAIDLHAAELPPDAAWVLGNEGQGVRPALQAAATLRLRIDQEPAAESLNVAAAAAVCLFEQRRQARHRQ